MEICHQILEQIKKYDTIIIHRHMRADPDALGSQVGLKELLQYNFPDKKIKVVGYDLPTLTWLAKMDEVKEHLLLFVIQPILLESMINVILMLRQLSRLTTIQTMKNMEIWFG